MNWELPLARIAAMFGLKVNVRYLAGTRPTSIVAMGVSTKTLPSRRRSVQIVIIYVRGFRFQTFPKRLPQPDSKRRHDPGLNHHIGFTSAPCVLQNRFQVFYRNLWRTNFHQNQS